jgi:hypothetical protein
VKKREKCAVSHQLSTSSFFFLQKIQAGITTTLNSRTSVLAAANCPFCSFSLVSLSQLTLHSVAPHNYPADSHVWPLGRHKAGGGEH